MLPSHVPLHRLSRSLSGISSVKPFASKILPLQPFTPQDLVFIEEAFERLLLDYDRVFSAMGVPACLWRRTGEIYKGNREFTELVGVDGYMMRDVSPNHLRQHTALLTWLLGPPVHIRVDGRRVCCQLLGGASLLTSRWACISLQTEIRPRCVRFHAESSAYFLRVTI